MTKIFLEENRNVLSNNVPNQINVEFETKNRLLPDESLSDTFSMYEQYVKERDECSKYRFIFNINPLCTNVLFNIISEITVNEGGNTCSCLNFVREWQKSVYANNATNTKDKITYWDAIRNTEYSNENNGGFQYHCGVDIFNNHMLRKKIFMHINKMNENSSVSCGTVYNTIEDYLRDANGDIVKEPMNIRFDNRIIENDESNQTPRHVYDTGSLDSLKNAFYGKCHEENGWWGFTNPGMINISTTTSSSISTNEMLSDHKPCEFIDMYPDRTLFSFVPKYNSYRRRLEPNWDYCITYPYAKDNDLINKVCGGKNGEIKAVVKTTESPSGIRLLQCTSLFKHNFSVGSNVSFYYYMSSGATPEPDRANVIRPLKTSYTAETAQQTSATRGAEYNHDDLQFYKYIKDIRVFSVGDANGNYKDRVFSVKYDDVKDLYPYFGAYGCYYKRVSNRTECSYYARKFKKINNTDGSSLNSEINKTAYATNIYGDDIAQIVYTDSVDTYGLKDENGRDVSEVYLTVVKRNRGYSDWYGGNTANESVEYSHCFGKLTSGIDFSGVDVNEEPFDYNVHYLHNIDSSSTQFNFGGNSYATMDEKHVTNTISAWGDTILAGMPKFIESGITIDENEFYGDIVEFDNYNYQATVIGKVFHRFNTVQRESFGLIFRDLKQDIVSYDDYDATNVTFGTDNVEYHGFTVDTYYCNDTVDGLHKVDGDGGDTMDNLMCSNIMPEGYFYDPHIAIKLKEESDVKHSDAIYINYDKCKVESNVNGNHTGSTTATTGSTNTRGGGSVSPENTPKGIILTVSVPVDYGFIKGDYVALYNKVTKEIKWGCITAFNNPNLTVFLNYSDFSGESILTNSSYFMPENGNRRYFMFWSKDSVPIYAKLSMETLTFSWKNIMKVSELDKNSELYDLPFSNGNIYVQKNINFSLKRQDPRGEYGLSYPLFMDNERKVFNVMTKYIVNGSDKIDLSKYYYLFNNRINNCF